MVFNASTPLQGRADGLWEQRGRGDRAAHALAFHKGQGVWGQPQLDLRLSGSIPASSLPLSAVHVFSIPADGRGINQTVAPWRMIPSCVRVCRHLFFSFFPPDCMQIRVHAMHQFACQASEIGFVLLMAGGSVRGVVCHIWAGGSAYFKILKRARIVIVSISSQKKWLFISHLMSETGDVQTEAEIWTLLISNISALATIPMWKSGGGKNPSGSYEESTEIK